MDPALILVIVLGLSVLVFIVFAIFMMKTVVAGAPVVVEDADPDTEPKPEQDGRPWFARPQTWILFAMLFLFIGLFITPKIFGFTFIFFPFFWIRGAFRRQRPNPPHGHHREPPGR